MFGCGVKLLVMVEVVWWISSFPTFLILFLLAKNIDLVLSSPKWILSLLSTNQSQRELKSSFNHLLITSISL